MTLPVFPAKFVGVPFAIEESCPPGEMYFLPPDVTKATAQALEIAERAINMLWLYWFGPWLVGPSFFVVSGELAKLAMTKAKAADYSWVGAVLTIEAAAQERRVGRIKNIDV